MSERQEPPHPPRQAARHAPPPPPPLIWALILVFVAFELAFALFEGWRFEVYYTLGFWDLYFEGLRNGQEVPAEFWASFITHAFLHGGVLHLVMNGVIFLSLGGLLTNVLGTARFAILFAVTASAGALAFAIIADSQGPLVGASGVIFGFFGAFKFWEMRHNLRTGASWRRFFGTIFGLIAINVALFFFLPGGGQLAWEAHLGGFVAGFLMAPLLGPKISGPSPI